MYLIVFVGGTDVMNKKELYNEMEKLAKFSVIKNS